MLRWDPLRERLIVRLFLVPHRRLACWEGLANSFR